MSCLYESDKQLDILGRTLENLLCTEGSLHSVQKFALRMFTKHWDTIVMTTYCSCLHCHHHSNAGYTWNYAPHLK